MSAPPERPLRLATWNIEWFDRLFDRHDRPRLDGGWSARHDVTRRRQAEAIAEVLARLDADGIVIQEAPDTRKGRSTVRALENFAAHFGLRQRRAVIGFPSHTNQEIAFLHDPDRLHARHAPVGVPHRVVGGHAPRFDSEFLWDLDMDSRPERIRFSKPPLELALTTPAGRTLRFIGVHLKSRNVHERSQAHHLTPRAVAARRLQLGQCIWLRRRVEEHLVSGDDLVVGGDFNDGPHLAQDEAILPRSGVEIVMAPEAPEELRLHDPHARAALAGRPGPVHATARFHDARTGRFVPALLDYMMVSWRPAGPQAALAHLASLRGSRVMGGRTPARCPARRLRPLSRQPRPPALSGLPFGSACAHIAGMPKHAAALALACLLALPVAAATPEGNGNAPPPGDAEAGQDGSDMIREGLRLFIEGLKRETEPLVDEMRRELEELGPMLERLLELMGDVRNYEAPEMLPNGDIIIRRRPDAPPPPLRPAPEPEGAEGDEIEI